MTFHTKSFKFVVRTAENVNIELINDQKLSITVDSLADSVSDIFGTLTLFSVIWCNFCYIKMNVSHLFQIIIIYI